MKQNETIPNDQKIYSSKNDSKREISPEVEKPTKEEIEQLNEFEAIFNPNLSSIP